MYFTHRFPLTSHIRGHMLSSEMALLHLSTYTQCVDTQKNKIDGSGQNPIDVHVPSYIVIFPAWPIFYKVSKENLWLFPLQPMNHSWVLTLQPTHTWSRLEFTGFPYEIHVSLCDLQVLIVVNTLIQTKKYINKFSRGHLGS